MTFLHVATWGGIALAILAALLVLALYLLRPPPQQLMVPSRLLWQLVLEEQDRRRAWLRWLLSLLISLAAVLALLGVLTGFERSATGSRDLFLIVDDAATMATMRSDGRSRFEHAREYASGRVSNAGGAIHLATTSGSFGPARVSREQGLEALAGFAPQLHAHARFPKVPPDLDPRTTDLVLLTDGVAELGSSGPLEVVSVFEPATNAGILAFEARAVPGSSASVQAFLEITNASQQPANPLLRVGPQGGAAVLERRLALAPLETWSGLLEMPADQLEAGVSWLAKLELEGDALEQDDSAWLFPPDVRQTRVTLIRGPEPKPHLTRALLLDQRIQLDTVPHERYGDWEPSGDVLVFAGFAPAQPPSLPWLLIAPPPAPWLPRPEDEQRSVAIEETTIAQPLALELEDLQIELLPRFANVGRLLVTASATQTPLLFEWLPTAGAGGRAQDSESESGERGWVLAFEPERSNLIKKQAFPILLSQVVHALGKRHDASARASVRELPNGLRQFEETVTSVSGPDGERLPLRLAGDGKLAQLGAPGVYQSSERNGTQKVLATPPIGRALSLVNGSSLLGQPALAPLDAPSSLTRTLLIAIALVLIVGEALTLRLGFTE